MTYPPLPTCDPRQPGETMPEYAARVLRFLLSTSCTATLSDEQLAQADTAAQRAISQAEDLAIIQTLSNARHSIAAVLTFRKQLDHISASPRPAYPEAGKQPGSPAILQPPPAGRPPQGSYAQPSTIAKRSVADGIRF